MEKNGASSYPRIYAKTPPAFFDALIWKLVAANGDAIDIHVAWLASFVIPAELRSDNDHGLFGMSFAKLVL
ncbi:MAG: hypothetical protein FWD77_05800 [Betaproteobacteria bacterium]|nr:hypothetical protein [Betaproteobacteria bacterium]